MKVRIYLVTVNAADGTPLDGALYTQDNDPRPNSERKLFYPIHGRSMNFYLGLPRLLPPVLVPLGYDALALNRRGAGVISIRDSFHPLGDAWAKFNDHRMDVEAGIRRLKGLGYCQFIILGHSQGGLLAADYAARNADVCGLILASPIWTHSGIPLTTILAEERAVLTKRAKEMVAEGRGQDLLFLPGWTWAISAEAVVDALTPGLVAPLDRLLGKYEGPLLIFCGDEGIDSILMPKAKEAFDSCPSRMKEFVVLHGSDHFYSGFEDKIEGLVVEWLKKNVP